MGEQDNRPQKPLFRYEPGELEKTRKNLGFVEADEAKKMMQVLGGEVGLEKSAPVDEKAIRKVRSARMSQDLRSGNASAKSGGRRGGSPDSDRVVIVKTVAPGSNTRSSGSATSAPKEVLPYLDNKTRNKMDKLMMMPEYGIKVNYGIFNFINNFRKNGFERVSEQFASVTLEAYITRLKTFKENTAKLIALAPKPVQEKIAQDSATQYKMLRVIKDWPTGVLDSIYKALIRNPNTVTITSLVSTTRLIYKFILSVFFIGEQRFNDLLKLVYSEINTYPKVQKEELVVVVQAISADWLYVSQRISKGMYPLLLRMSCNEVFDFSELFTKQLTKVFNFLGITKYDLVLPEKSSKANAPETTEEVKAKTEEESSEEQTDEKNSSIPVGDFPGTQMGLKILDRIFPGAGWLNLESLPDMYPFFQPLYRFQDGFNLIAPENPLQITIVLVKIIEDMLEGCRPLVFELDKDNGNSESLSSIMNDWSNYREVVFEKLYLPNLRDFGNNLYAQKDFARNQYGKRLISSLQWHTYYNFLPYMKFEQVLLDKPANESKIRALPIRVSILVEELARITTAADAAQSAGRGFSEVPNIFEPYKFAVQNVVSQRINVLLGAGKQKQATPSRATNLNLLKYIYAVASVLDWWINCKTSPAYGEEKIPICRISPEDGQPIFSIPEREDQNLLFARSIKAQATKPKTES